MTQETWERVDFYVSLRLEFVYFDSIARHAIFVFKPPARGQMTKNQ